MCDIIIVTHRLFALNYQVLFWPLFPVLQTSRSKVLIKGYQEKRFDKGYQVIEEENCQEAIQIFFNLFSEDKASSLCKQLM